MSALKGQEGEAVIVISVLSGMEKRRKKNTDRERKVRQDLTLHQLNDAGPLAMREKKET